MSESEEQIAARVAQNIPREDMNPSTPPDTDSSSPEETGYTVNLDDAQLTDRLANYFNLTNYDKYHDKSQVQMRAILQWASDTSGSAEVADLLVTIHTLERELGISMKPNRMALVYKFIKLQHESRQIQNEMELLRGGF